MCAFDKPTFAERFFVPLPIDPIPVTEAISIVSLALEPGAEKWLCNLVVGYAAISGETGSETIVLRDRPFGLVMVNFPKIEPAKEVIDDMLNQMGVVKAHLAQLSHPHFDAYKKVSWEMSFLEFMAGVDDEIIAKRIEDREKMRSLISLCGLTQAEAAVVLEVSHDTVRQRLTGNRPAPNADPEIRTLLRVWRRIQLGDVKGLPEGAKRQAAILAFARQAKID